MLRWDYCIETYCHLDLWVFESRRGALQVGIGSILWGLHNPFHVFEMRCTLLNRFHVIGWNNMVIVADFVFWEPLEIL